MWRVLRLACTFFLIYSFPSITLALEECGVPAKPSHGQLRPDKPLYNYGDKVHAICEKNYFLFGKEKGIQTCNKSSWLGKPPVCLRNVAYGRSITHFGSPSGGQMKPHGGNFTYRVKNASESFFFDMNLEKSFKHAYVYFHGSFSVTDQNNNHLAFDQTVVAFNNVDDPHLYQPCPKSPSGDYFDCNSPDGRPFIGAKVQIELLNKNIDVTNNNVQVNLQIETNGFVVASLSDDKDCGTPPSPLHGSASMQANSTDVIYTCSPGYILHGKSVQTCDISNYPEIEWKSSTPLCIESPKNVQVNTEEPSTISSTIVIAVVVTNSCIVVILVVGGIIWFCKKTREQNQMLPTGISMIERPPSDGSKSGNSENYDWER